jgi:hypothetical protein
VLASAGHALDPSARAFFEPRFGHDFGNIRIHADGSAAASARAVDAHAYTVGRHVVFGHGKYAPDRAEGRWLLAHELAHVVQQGSVVRRNSISPPLQSGPGDEEHGSADDEDEEDATAAKSSSHCRPDEAGPKADLSDRGMTSPFINSRNVEAKGLILMNASSTTTYPRGRICSYAADGQPFGAVTGSQINNVAVPSQECWMSITGHAGPPRQFQGAFTPGSSWVKPHIRDAADPTKNGSAAIITKCQTAFDAAAAKNMINVTWNLSTAVDAACPASVRPAGTKATTRAECSTVVAATSLEAQLPNRHVC